MRVFGVGIVFLGGFWYVVFGLLLVVVSAFVGLDCLAEVKNGGSKIVKNGPRVWAFCKIEFPGIQKPVQILAQKSGFFRNPGNRGVGVIWQVSWGSAGWLSLGRYWVGVLLCVDSLYAFFVWGLVLCLLLLLGWVGSQVLQQVIG